jgi:hypothetical protein
MSRSHISTLVCVNSAPNSGYMRLDYHLRMTLLRMPYEDDREMRARKREQIGINTAYDVAA